MLREPYNLAPYNATIDTSVEGGNEFSFYFSGDKLGAFSIQVEENNTGELISSLEKQTVSNIYDGSKVSTQVQLNNALNKDLIWRAVLYENNNAPINYVRSNQIIAKLSTPLKISGTSIYSEIGINTTYINTHTGTSESGYTSVVRNCWVDDTAQYLLSKNNNTYTFTIPRAYSRGYDLVEHKDVFISSSQTEVSSFIVIDNHYFAVTECAYDITPNPTAYILTLQLLDNTDVSTGYYGYELIFKDGTTIGSEDDTVTYYFYNTSSINDASWKMMYNQATSLILNNQITYVYALYSTGMERGYLTDSLSDFPLNSTYSLYNNFYISNWSYFEARKNPTLFLQYYDTIHDNSVKSLNNLTDYNFRSIHLTAAYSQDNNIAVRYYQWTISYNNEIIDQSDEIYNASLDYTFAPFTYSTENSEPYTFTLKVVNQAGVVIEKQASVSTSFTNTQYLNTSSCYIDEKQHYSKIIWENALSSAPTDQSLDSLEDVEYHNDIDVGNHYNINILNNSHLTYANIGGDTFNKVFSDENFSFRTGFVIGDKVNNKLTYYNADVLRLGSAITLHKEKTHMTIDGKEFEENWYLLDSVLGFFSPQSLMDNLHYGQEMVWIDGENSWIDDDSVWYETTSDTTCFYYEMVTDWNEEKNTHQVKVYRYIYERGNTESVDGFLHLPYNNLIANDWIVPGITDLVCRTVDINGNIVDTPAYIVIASSSGMTIGGGTREERIPLSVSGEYVLYRKNPNKIFELSNLSINSGFSYYGVYPMTQLYYTEIYNKKTTLSPLGFGEKPTWLDDEDKKKDGLQFLLTFTHKSLYSSYMLETQGAGEGVVTDYEVWRWKFRTEEDAKQDKNPIYTRYLGTINLVNEGLTTSPFVSFTDYTIENNGWYYYHIIPLGIADQALYKTNWQTNPITHITEEFPIHADWYGWSFTSFVAKNNRYQPIEHWIYYLNLESNGYTHVVDKVIDQGFYRYPRVSVGNTNYITSQLTGLIGEFKQTLAGKTGLSTWNDYLDDNIERILRWENFISNGNLILVKDYKGRAYIASLDSSTMKFTDVASRVLSTVSFNITQIEDDANYAIFSLD